MTRLLTVGLPVYNSMPYLPEAFESLLSQTVGDFDILAIVDDCNDGSVEYVESLRDPRLRVIRQPKAGLTPTLNRMLREITTPWLVRLDTDDVSFPKRIQKTIENILENPGAGMFYSLASYYPKDQSVGMFRCTRGTPEELRKVVESGYLLSFCHSSAVLNVEKALAIGGYRKEVYVEDADMWWRMALNHPIHLIPEELVGFRHSPQQSSSKFLLPQAVHGLYVQYLLLSHLWGLRPESAEAVEPLLHSLVLTKDLKSKQHLREINMQLQQRNIFGAIAAGGQAFVSSPRFFLKRVVEELRPSHSISNGVDPSLYLQRKAEFWPAQ